MEFYYIIGAIILAYVVYLVFDYQRSTKIPKNHKQEAREPTIEEKNEVIPDKEFTYEELAKFNGENKGKSYLAIQNVVFDVSESDNYKPGGSYAVFAGKDCSVALGKMAFNDEYMNVYQTTQLTASEYDSMVGWFHFMKKKYPIVGRIKESKKDQ